MSKKGEAQILGAIVVIILALFIFSSLGIINLPWLKQNKYIVEIQIPKNITRYEGLNIDILILNPEDNVISPYLEIKYNDTYWSTSNRYIRFNERIPIGSIRPGSIEKYSIEFSPKYTASGKIHTFKFFLFEDNRILDTSEVKVYVKR